MELRALHSIGMLLGGLFKPQVHILDPREERVDGGLEILINERHPGVELLPPVLDTRVQLIVPATENSSLAFNECLSPFFTVATAVKCRKKGNHSFLKSCSLPTMGIATAAK